MTKKRCMTLILLAVWLVALMPGIAAASPMWGWDGKSYQYAHLGSMTAGNSMPEPILWRVLSVTDDYALLLSEKALTARPFDDNSSNWGKSDIKAWLNDTFLKEAFKSDEVRAALVHDKELGRIFLLSKGDYLNEEYGFSTDANEGDKNRIAVSHANAIAHGIWATDGDLFCSHYTRTDRNKESVWQVKAGGSLSVAKFDRENVGIRPAVCIDLSKLSVDGGDGTLEHPFEIE